MTEPKRLIDTTEDPNELALLQAGRGAFATAELRANVLSQLGLAPSASSANIVRFPARTRRIALAALVVSTLAAAVPLAYYSLAHKAAIPTATDARESKPVPVVTEARPVSVEESKTPEATPVIAKREAVEPRRVAATAVSNKPVASDYLALELKALDSVRKKMHSGDPKGALTALDAYQRDFSKPHLALEAEVLRIFALDQSGQKDVAKRRAQSFIAKYPKGVLSTRVRRYLAQ